MSSEVEELFAKPISSAANRRKIRFFSNASLVCKYITKECFVNGYLLKRAQENEFLFTTRNYWGVFIPFYVV